MTWRTHSGSRSSCSAGWPPRADAVCPRGVSGYGIPQAGGTVAWTILPCGCISTCTCAASCRTRGHPNPLSDGATGARSSGGVRAEVGHHHDHAVVALLQPELRHATGMPQCIGDQLRHHQQHIIASTVRLRGTHQEQTTGDVASAFWRQRTASRAPVRRVRCLRRLHHHCLRLEIHRSILAVAHAPNPRARTRRCRTRARHDGTSRNDGHHTRVPRMRRDRSPCTADGAGAVRLLSR